MTIKNQSIILVLTAVVVICGLLIISSCSLFNRKTEEPSRGNFFGWLEYERASKDISTVRAMYFGMPNGDKLQDAFEFHGIFHPLHTPDEAFRAYHYHGPFKSVLAVKANMKMGKLDGTATFWNEHGKIFKQRVFKEDMLVESKNKAPWLDNETDQTLPDGVYTFFEGEDFRSLDHSNYPTVGRQEVFKKGKMVETITANGEWKPVEEGFWKCMTGRVLCVPSRTEPEWFLNRRKLQDGTRLLIQGYEEPVVFSNKIQPFYPDYTDLQGRTLDTVGTRNAIFSWPEDKM
jgi:hypothetical protein